MATSADAAQSASKTDTVKNVVLVHGGFVDGSGWNKVYQKLKKDGYLIPGGQGR